MFRQSLLLLCSLVFATACGPEGSDPGPRTQFGTAQAEIVNGYLDNGHPQVVQVSVPGRYDYLCSGTLIGPRTVLTAAHCVTQSGIPFPTVEVSGVMWEYDPDNGGWGYANYYFTGTPIPHPSAGWFGPDVAVIRLNQTVQGVTPAALATTVYPGLPLTLVGFGGAFVNDPYAGVIKRYGFNTVDRTDATFLYFDGATGAESATCYGDSGGPAFGGSFYSNCVAGVTRGQLDGEVASNCTENAGEWLHTRVDTAAAWIRAQATEPIAACTP